MALGLGGLISKKIEAGLAVREVIVGVSDYNAEHGAEDFRLTCQANMAENLTAKANVSGTVYDYMVCEPSDGAKMLENMYDATPRGVLADTLENALSKNVPQELYIPRASYNQDHQAVYDACRVMLRPGSRMSKIPRIWLYEVPGQQEVPGGVYVQLTKKNAMAKAALVEHHKQASTYPQNPEGVLAWARKRGLEIGTEYAEKIWPLKVIL